MKYVRDVSKKDLHGVRVLVRAGLDVPLDDTGEVSDLFRVRQSVETLRYLSECGARVIVISHIGRDPKETNAAVAKALSHFLKVMYVPDLVGHAAKSAVKAVAPGEVLLLENLRQDPRETANDEGFARELAAYGEMYVNDAFSASHREHASMVLLPKLLPSFAGLLIQEEIRQLDRARTPGSPSFAILGGAKFETKAPLIRNLLSSYGHVFITGALANDIFKARGLETGVSLLSKEAPSSEVLSHTGFLAPVDVTVQLQSGQARVKAPDAVEKDEKIVDIGPDSIALIAPRIAEAQFILWNGPTGLYEDGYTSYTHAIAGLIARRVREGAMAVIGGGDTIAAIHDSGERLEDLGFLSTGGGAMLEYLLDGVLPALEALE